MVLETKLLTDLSAAVAAIPDLKHIGLYNMRAASVAAGLSPVHKFPAAWFEFVYGAHYDEPGGWQRVELTVRVYVCAFELKVPDSFILELKERVHRKIQGLKDQEGFYSPLNRVEQEQNLEHGNLPTWVLSYACEIMSGPADEKTGALSDILVQKA